MDIKEINKGKEVYSVNRLFSKEDMLNFVSDGGLLKYKRILEEQDRAEKEFKVDIKVSTFLSFFAIFSFLSMFIIYYSGFELILTFDLIIGLVIFIIPCIVSVLALMKYTDYKEQIFKKYSSELSVFKEDYYLASKFTLAELETYSIINKKVRGIKGEVNYYKMSTCLLSNSQVGNNALALFNTESLTWYILEYCIIDKRLEAYKLNEVKEDSNIFIDWH